MFGFIIAVILLSIMASALRLERCYFGIPLTELKRRARRGNHEANGLYRAAAYGDSLKFLLWSVVALTGALSFVLLARTFSPFIAFVLDVLIIALCFVLLPSRRISGFEMSFTRQATPLLVSFLARTHPFLERCTRFVRKHWPVTVHTGLYEREDLLVLLERQKIQADSRLSVEELELAMHALTFGDRQVGDIMIPKRQVRTVSASEATGPIVIRELHDSGFSRFPVYGEKHDDIVGVLYLRDLVSLKKTGPVADVMDKSVFYVHEEYPLEQALHAFLRTKHHLFVVVDSFEQYVGILTIEDILEQILGCKIVDEFDQYDNLRAVAGHKAAIEHAERQAKDAEPPEVDPGKTDSKVVE